MPVGNLEEVLPYAQAILNAWSMHIEGYNAVEQCVYVIVRRYARVVYRIYTSG